MGGSWTYAKPAKRTKTEAVTIPIPPLLEPERHAALLVYLEKTTSPKTAEHVHPLSGLLVGECGHNYTGVARKDRGRRRYRCQHMKDTGKGWTCPAPTVLGQELDDLVWAEVVRLLAEPEVLVAAAQDHLGLVAGTAAVDAEGHHRALAEVERCQRALSDAFAQGLKVGLDEDTMREAIASLKADLALARQHAEAVAALRVATREQADRLSQVQALADLARERLQDADDVLRAEVLRLLDVRVRVLALGPMGEPLEVELKGSVVHRRLLDDLAPSQRGVLSCENRRSRYGRKILAAPNSGSSAASRASSGARTHVRYASRCRSQYVLLLSASRPS